MHKQKPKTLITMFIVVVLLITSTGTALAHELFEVSNNLTREFFWKWETSSSNQAYLKCNDDYLDSPYSSQYTNARNAWNASGIQCYNVDYSFSGSNVDFATTTSSWWASNVGNNNVLGRTKLVNEDGQDIMYVSSPSTCNNMIKYAAIYINPDSSGISSDEQKYILVHEMAHVMAIGHVPSSFGSDTIMKIYNGSFTTPRSHDITDVNDKYPDD